MKRPAGQLPLKFRVERARNDDRELSRRPAAARLLNILLEYADADTGTCRPDRETLQRRMGYRGSSGGRGALQRLIRELADELGYLTVTAQRRGRLILGETYALKVPKPTQLEMPLAAPPRVDEDSPGESARTHPRVDEDSLVSPIRENKEEEQGREQGGGEARVRSRPIDLDRLEGALVAAAAVALDPVEAALTLRVLSEPLSWLAAGCDLDLDVLPTVRVLAAKAERPVRTWKYFRRAVLAARDDRRRTHPPPAMADGAEGFSGKEEQNARAERDRKPETRTERLLRLARADAARRQGGGPR